MYFRWELGLLGGTAFLGRTLYASANYNCLWEKFDISTYLTLENCLFGAVKLTTHPDID